MEFIGSPRQVSFFKSLKFYSINVICEPGNEAGVEQMLYAVDRCSHYEFSGIEADLILRYAEDWKEMETLTINHPQKKLKLSSDKPLHEILIFIFKNTLLECCTIQTSGLTVPKVFKRSQYFRGELGQDEGK